MSFPPNPDFDKFIYKSSDLRTKEPSKEQYIQIEANTGTSTGTFETFVNTYLYKIVGNKYQLLGDKKIVIQETDEVVITNKNGKIVKVIKDPINSSEEEETIEVIEDGEPVIKTFTTLYYSYESKNNPETLCRNLIDVAKEFYLNRALPSVFNFSPNTDRLFSDQVIKTPFDGDNKWYGVSRTQSTSRPEVIIQISTDGLILDTFECPLPIEESTDIIQVGLNFGDGIKNIPVPDSPVDPELPPLLPDPGAPTVSATFDTKGGTLIGAQSGPSPLYVSQPPNPSKGGFIFNGFSPTLPAVITEDTVFTAIFTPEPPTIGLPDVVTSFASNIKADSAVIGGHVVNANNSPVESRGSVFREIIFEDENLNSTTTINSALNNATPKIKPEPLQGVRNTSTGQIWVFTGTTWENKTNNVDNYLNIDSNGGITSDGEGLGIFVSELEGLNSGREYIYRAYATNADSNGQDQVSYGIEKSFETTPLDVQTSVPFDLTPISGKGGGLILNTGDLTILSRGLLLVKSSATSSLDTSLTLQNALEGQKISIGNENEEIILIPDPGDLANSLFRLDLGELEPDTSYKVRAYATNARGTNGGEIKSFVTLPKPLPVINTPTVPTTIGTTSVSTQITITDVGFDDVFEVGIIISPNAETPNINTPSPNQRSNTRQVTVRRDEVPKTFTVGISGLNPNTGFNYRVFAKNSGGPKQSGIITFTTSQIPQLVSLPGVSIKNFSYSGGQFFTLQAEVTSLGEPPANSIVTKGVETMTLPEDSSQVITREITPPTFESGNTFYVNDFFADVNDGDLVIVRAFVVDNMDRKGYSLDSEEVLIFGSSSGLGQA